MAYTGQDNHQLQQQANRALTRFFELGDELDRQHPPGSFFPWDQMAEVYTRMATQAERVRQAMQVVADDARRRAR